MHRAESAIAGLALAVLAYGLAMVLLLPAPFTRALSARESQLPPEQSAVLAEEARRFVVSGDVEARRALSEVMTPDAVTHLDDVRRVIAAGVWATALLFVSSLVWAVLRYRAGHGPRIARALGIGAVVSAGSVVLVGLFALLDFDTFFAGFHALFFEPGTWQFPSDSVLIRLFPERFWVVAAASWAALIAAVAGLYALAAMAVRAISAASPSADGARAKHENA